MHNVRHAIAKGTRGFTLIELMVVIVILGILAGLIVPRIMSRPDEAKVTRAKVDMKGIEEALGLFKLDNGFYPSTEQGLSALVVKPETGRIPARYSTSAYLKKLPVDPWDKPYIYLSPGVVNRDYDLMSYGADGQPGGEGFDADIKSWEIQ